MSQQTDSSEAKSPSDAGTIASLTLTFVNIVSPPKSTKGKAKGRAAAVARALFLVAGSGFLSGATEGAFAAAIKATYADADAMNQFSQ